MLNFHPFAVYITEKCGEEKNSSVKNHFDPTLLTKNLILLSKDSRKTRLLETESCHDSCNKLLEQYTQAFLIQDIVNIQ